MEKRSHNPRTRAAKKPILPSGTPKTSFPPAVRSRSDVPTAPTEFLQNLAESDRKV